MCECDIPASTTTTTNVTLQHVNYCILPIIRLCQRVFYICVCCVSILFLVSNTIVLGCRLPLFQSISFILRALLQFCVVSSLLFVVPFVSFLQIRCAHYSLLPKQPLIHSFVYAFVHFNSINSIETQDDSRDSRVNFVYNIKL